MTPEEYAHSICAAYKGESNIPIQTIYEWLIAAVRFGQGQSPILMGTSADWMGHASLGEPAAPDPGVGGGDAEARLMPNTINTPTPPEAEKQQQHDAHPYSERACQGWHWRPQGEISNPQPPTGEAAGVSGEKCDYCGGTGEIACSSTHYEKCPHCNGTGIACQCAVHAPSTPEAGGAGVRESIAARALPGMRADLLCKVDYLVPLDLALALEAERDAEHQRAETLGAKLFQAKTDRDFYSKAYSDTADELSYEKAKVDEVVKRAEAAESQVEIWEDLFGTTDAQHARAELDRARRSTVDPSALQGLIEKWRHDMDTRGRYMDRHSASNALLALLPKIEEEGKE